MDILMIEAVVAELQIRLSGARFEKIFQPESDTLILRLWNGRETLRLLLSASPRFPKLYLTRQTYPNPAAPPRFCQLLRARLKRLVDVRQIPGERIVEFHCAGPDGIPYKLMAELVGRHANLLLIDEKGTIIDLLERRPGTAGGRNLMPGETYRLPALRELQALENWDGTIPENLQEPDELARWLFRNLSPMSSFVARELAARRAEGEDLSGLIPPLLRARAEGAYEPVVGHLEGDPFIAPYPVRSLDLEDPKSYASPSEAAEEFHRLLIDEAGDIGEQRRLHRVIDRRLKRVRGRLEKIRSEGEDAGKAALLREKGELLLANLHRMRSGMERVTLENYYRDPPEDIEIRLDPMINPQENAQAYFQKYKKAQRSAEHIERRLQETQEELDWLEDVAFTLEHAEEPTDITEIRNELEEAGLMPSAGRLQKKVFKDLRSQLRAAKTPGGYPIYWGKNSKTNDYVSRELADPGDYWFHAHRVPGSHLVLKVERKGEEVPDEDLLYAAAVAAGFSKAATSGKAEVIVARAEDVRKPRGARPGLVTVEKYRTMMVRPMDLRNEDRGARDKEKR